LVKQGKRKTADRYPPLSLNSTAWVVGLVQQAWSIHRQITPSALEQSSKADTVRNLESNSTAWVAYRAHG